MSTSGTLLRANSMNKKSRASIFALLSLLLVSFSGRSVEGAKRRQQRQRRQIETQTGPTDEQIWDSGLIEKELSYATLLQKGREYYADTESRRFKNFVLGYVTPWNRAGYDNAVTFRRKLDAVAPVWFQIRQQDGHKAPDVVGSHEINKTWLSELRKDGTGPLVVPRFIIEAEPLQHVEMLQAPQGLLEAMGNTVVQHGFDGMVLETWAAWHGFNGLRNDNFRRAALGLVAALGRLLRENGNKKLYLAVPPLYPANEKGAWIEAKDLIELAPHVDGFSVMTYDYSTTQGRAGPNAPLPWVTTNLQMLNEGPLGKNEPLPEEVRERILLGINFYGWDFAPSRGGLSAVTATDLASLLHRHQPQLAWGADHEEHSFGYQDKEGHEHTVWYPTPRSVEVRLQVARDNNVGISIWELGQGLERFFDLL